MFYERSAIYITNKRTHSAGRRHILLITLHGIVLCIPPVKGKTAHNG